MLPGNIIGAQPGLELLTPSKASLAAGGCESNTHYVWGSTPDLPALGWGQNTTSQIVGPSIWKTELIDILATRDQIEVHSMLVKCGPVAHTIFEWRPSQSGPQCYEANLLYQRALAANESVGAMDGSAPADLIEDSREELAIYRLYQPDNPFTHYEKGEVVIVKDTTGIGRTEASPWRYHEYRRHTYDRGSGYLDYEALDGLRFMTRRLAVGKANAPYGVQQDLNLDRSVSTPRRGCAIVPEGGTPPYVVTVENPQMLQAGLVPQTILGAGAPQVHQGLLLIHGTPTEVATRRLQVKVVDAAQNQLVEDFWLIVGNGFGVPQADQAPRIVAGGYDVQAANGYLKASTPTAITFRAWVQDPGGDVVCVKLFDMQDNLLGALFPVQQGSDVFELTLLNQSLAAGSYFFKMIAVDAAARTSLVWPYLTVDGGAGEQNPSFEPEDPQNGQDESNTPVIDRVELPANTIQPAETSDDGAGQQAITVYLKYVPPGMSVDGVTAIVRHNVAGVDLPAVALSESASDSMVYEGTFNAPASWMGWGHYTVNVHVKVRDASNNVYVSDKWPRLRAH